MSISPVPKGRLIFGGLIVAVGLGMMLYFNVFHKGEPTPDVLQPETGGSGVRSESPGSRTGPEK